MGIFSSQNLHFGGWGGGGGGGGGLLKTGGEQGVPLVLYQVSIVQQHLICISILAITVQWRDSDNSAQKA